VILTKIWGGVIIKESSIMSNQIIPNQNHDLTTQIVEKPKSRIVTGMVNDINRENKIAEALSLINSLEPIFPANLYEEYGVDWRATETPEKIAQVEANLRFIPNPAAQARGKELMKQHNQVLNAKEESWEDLEPFEDSTTGKWGYLNSKTNEIIFEPQFDFADDFCEGMARIGMLVNFNEYRADQVLRYGYISESRLVIKPIYDFASYFSCGFALIGFNGERMYTYTKNFINKQGKYIRSDFWHTTPDLFEIKDFDKNGEAETNMQGRRGCIDINGRHRFTDDCLYDYEQFYEDV
jgi:WG containing repeat